MTWLSGRRLVFPSMCNDALSWHICCPKNMLPFAYVPRVSPSGTPSYPNLKPSFPFQRLVQYNTSASGMLKHHTHIPEKQKENVWNYFLNWSVSFSTCTISKRMIKYCIFSICICSVSSISLTSDLLTKLKLSNSFIRIRSVLYISIVY